MKTKIQPTYTMTLRVISRDEEESEEGNHDAKNSNRND